ncbi:MAG: pyridoxamine 5'-phosphate oxidase family protein [Acidimicrobiales bacterium]
MAVLDIRGANIVQRQGGNPISASECWELLKGEVVGRLALSLRALPAILPVQYYVDGEDLAICLGHHEIPHQAVDGTVVAFAADSIDAPTRVGWTVQVLGITRVPRPIGMPTDCGQPIVGQIVHLRPAKVTGFSIRLCPFVSPHHDWS